MPPVSAWTTNGVLRPAERTATRAWNQSIHPGSKEAMIRSARTLARARRPLLAALTLLGFLSASVEAVAGVVRDGSVHHETVSEALTHASHSGGHHGHEDLTDAPGQEHGPDHQHGTGADHCTHHHGLAFLAPPANPPLIEEVAVPALSLVATPSDHSPSPLFHPPRA